VGDPRYTPDKSVQGEGTEQERALAFAPEVAERLAGAEPPDVDLAMVHDQRLATELGGDVPLVLAGHTHNADEGRIEPPDADAEEGDAEEGDAEEGDATTDGSGTTSTGDGADEDGTAAEGGDDGDDQPETLLLVEGSTGGAGLRALEGAAPTPLEATVFYFDKTTRRLQAWDDVTLGGLGLTSAEINRTLAPEEAARLAAQKTDKADGAAKPAATGKATSRSTHSSTPSPPTAPSTAAATPRPTGAR
jgi:hypothetical protein